MKYAHTQKTPSAELAGRSAEGLISPITKKESTTMVSAAVPTRISLDEHTVIDVDPSVNALEYVEVTFSTRSGGLGEPRSTFGIALTPAEARRLAEALLDGSAPTFGQSPVAEIEEHVSIARKVPGAGKNTIAMSPAKCVKAQREFAKLDRPALAQGTVLDLLHASQKVGISPAALLEQLESEEASR